MAQFPEYERQEAIQPSSSTPDFGGAMREAGKAEWGTLGQIGAQVAQSASTAMAKNLGYEMGQTPKGDLMPPITDFDKQVTESYNAQSAATLSLQANKMMMDADVQVSQATRITPELISRTQNTMAQGMSQILDNAPTDIKTKLGYTFQNQLMSQTNNYQLKMISQDKDDQKNNLLAALQTNSDTAFQLAASGNIDGAKAVVENSRAIADSGPANNLFSPQQAYVNKQSIEDAAVNGKYIHEALTAKQNGKFEEWEANFAKNKPKDLNYRQWQGVGSAVTSYMGTLDNMRAQDENLRVAKMMTSIATDVNGITGSMLQDLKDNVSPIRYEQAKLKYINALKTNQQSGAGVGELIQGFSDPDLFARTTEKQKNKAFDTMVDGYVQQSQTRGVPISKEDAQVQVAASAGGTIPAFVSGLNNKAASANSQYIEAAAQQVHALREAGAGHALIGLNKEADALFTKYESLRASNDPVTAARMATDIVYNQTPEQQENNKQMWSNMMQGVTKGGTPHSEWALQQVDLSTKDFVNPSVAHVYGTDILDTYNSFYQMLNGDKDAALKNTKRVVSEQYGKTGVNGGEFETLHPLEKVLGYTDKGVVPYIQQDLTDQLNKKFMPIKEAYANKSTNEYWEVLPRDKVDKALFFGHDYTPIQVQRVQRIGNQEVKNKYDVVVQGNAYNQWDLSIKSDSGLRPIFQVAPYLGIVTYLPNKKAIDAAYLKDHPIK